VNYKLFLSIIFTFIFSSLIYSESVLTIDDTISKNIDIDTSIEFDAKIASNNIDISKNTVSTFNIASKNIYIASNNYEITFDDHTITHNEYFKELDTIKNDISEMNYTTAILALNNFISKLRDNQKKNIEKFFPMEFETFMVWEPNLNFELNMTYTDDFGALFSRRYRNNEGHSIDVNVVYSDPAIEEYNNIVKNPLLIDTIENIEIILIGTYNALEKFSLEEKYYEQNIIVNNDVLINIIANGIEDKNTINDFVSKINLYGLDQYLSK
jgi:hypothetical protein